MKMPIRVAPLLLLLLPLLAACGKGALACQVIDALSQACTVVRVMGPDGKPVDVPVHPGELQSFGEQLAAKRAAERAAAARDAGVP